MWYMFVDDPQNLRYHDYSAKKSIESLTKQLLRKRLYMLVMEKISVCRRTQILIPESCLYLSGSEKTPLSTFKKYKCQCLCPTKILQRSYQDTCLLSVSLIWKTSAFRGDVKDSCTMGISARQGWNVCMGFWWKKSAINRKQCATIT
jgi:hypothetical protein